MSMSLLLKFAVLACLWSTTFGVFYKQPNGNNDKLCFCQLQGTIDDCTCNVDTVDHFNNMKVYPRLNSLLSSDYFRFYKANLKQNCPFWADDSRCAMKFCSVQSCDERDVPEGIKGFSNESPAFKYTEDAQESPVVDCGSDLNAELSYLNTSISDKAHQGFQLWADHDEAQDNFCILDDHQEGAEYVDLSLNPERYTGYKGDSAHRIWRSIYLENCFGSSKHKHGLAFMPYIPYSELSSGGICMEERVFYRLISGLHSSINIHLCANYLLSEKKGFMSDTGVWGPNIEEFIRRFSPTETNNQGTHWLRNLYFAYIIELRALAKAAPYLRNQTYFTGQAQQDKEVREAIQDLLNVIDNFPSHFNESTMFSGGVGSVKLKQEFREKFRNISKIMDCVGCDKCRLWGKLQVQGLGTALKILFSGKFDNATELASEDNGEKLKLKRTEIVSLFNAFGRLSTSINRLEHFRKLMR
ncbi:ero1-like protein [Phlebotomus argentipes]|uniref:ero1-like protein n=1 Tax=Phlebotomus argentipes TaxID=94469 RepID=UPI0028935763|nr:ero1-like protein [Phlebotomus argentipes]